MGNFVVELGKTSLQQITQIWLFVSMCPLPCRSLTFSVKFSTLETHPYWFEVAERHGRDEASQQSLSVLNKVFVPYVISTGARSDAKCRSSTLPYNSQSVWCLFEESMGEISILYCRRTHKSQRKKIFPCGAKRVCMCLWLTDRRCMIASNVPLLVIFT